MVTVYGYARVSTKEPNEDRQILALRTFQISAKNIYIDKVSGKNFDRPKYRKLIKRMRENDLLCITSIDRLGRDYEEILE